jgi:hypothetical protein
MCVVQEVQSVDEQLGCISTCTDMYSAQQRKGAEMVWVQGTRNQRAADAASCPTTSVAEGLAACRRDTRTPHSLVSTCWSQGPCTSFLPGGQAQHRPHSGLSPEFKSREDWLKQRWRVKSWASGGCVQEKRFLMISSSATLLCIPWQEPSAEFSVRINIRDWFCHPEKFKGP